MHLHDQRGGPHPAHPACDGIVAVIGQNTYGHGGKYGFTVPNEKIKEDKFAQM
jgi:hypothetical protein